MHSEFTATKYVQVIAGPYGAIAKSIRLCHQSRSHANSTAGQLSRHMLPQSAMSDAPELRSTIALKPKRFPTWESLLVRGS